MEVIITRNSPNSRKGKFFDSDLDAFLCGGMLGIYIKNKKKYGRDGYDINGYDKTGFNRDGYDAEGYDRKGYDAEGYNRNGFNANGYNRLGFDRHGFDHSQYNASGVDRAGLNKEYYSAIFIKLRSRIGDAYRKMKGHEYRYALQDARTVLEETVRLLVQHSAGTTAVEDNLLANLKKCEKKGLLGSDSEFIDRLHSVRKICNYNGHDIDAEEEMSHDTVHFVVMQTRALLDFAEKALLER